MPGTTARAARTILLALILLAPAARSARAEPVPTPDGLVASGSPIAPYYFPETGHYVSGRFRQYWEANGGLAVFGLPLTKVFDEVSTDRLVHPTQYFERARFEWHQEMPQPYDVMLTLLGNEVTANRRDEAPFRPTADRDDCEGYAVPTGHNVCGAFYRFWQRNGGLPNFGYPLSEQFVERNAADGREYTVQYFERGRWEYHPEYAGTGSELLLGLLGLERLDRVGVAASVRAPEGRAPSYGELPYGMAPFPARAPHMEYGFNAYLLGNETPGAAAFNNRALGLVREAGFGWVRLQLVWRDFERVRGDYDWASLDARINAATASGAKVLVSVVRAPAWAAPSRPGGLPEDLAALHATMQALTGHYRGQVRAYEIWNEPNLASEVGGRVDVGAYTDTLKTAFAAIKEVDQSAIVLVGGLLPTTLTDPAVALDDTEFLRQVYRDGAGEYFDAVAVHPFGAANPPEALYPDNPGPGACPPRYAAQQGACWRDSRAYYFRRVEDLRAIMERNSDRKKQIWLTEFGWDACQGLPAPAGYEYCALTSEQQQAEYTVRAFDYANRNWPWLGVMFLWNLNYAAIPGIAPGDEKYGWSVLRADGSARPVFDAVKSMPKLPILPPECRFPAC